MNDPLPASTTHRLCHFAGAPAPTRQTVVPHYVADEVTELREFVAFLYPPRGQDRFVLQRPDALEFAWVVWDRAAKASYTAGTSPLQAVQHARGRLAAEVSGNAFRLQQELKTI